MNCIAETLCSDESYLDWLRAEQASNGSGQQQPPVVAENNKPNSGFVVTAPSPPTVATTPAQDSHKEETDQQPQQEVNVGSREPVLTPHQNPKGNVFFCAAVFDDITTNCLRSKVRLFHLFVLEMYSLISHYTSHSHFLFNIFLCYFPPALPRRLFICLRQ